MKFHFENGSIQQTQWSLEHITIKHSLVDYHQLSTQQTKNKANTVRLHFGLKGDYSFTYQQLNASYDLKGQHNNILYSDGLDLEIHNHSKQIETFGIEFETNAFIQIAQNGTDALKKLAEDVMLQKSSILSPFWHTNTLKIQHVIHEIIHCPYQQSLRQLFLQAKSIELLVLQAALYERPQKQQYIQKQADKKHLFEAKNILEKQLTNPPSIAHLAKMVGLNEYKLKKGFKELFGTTIFGYIHQNRMHFAKQLLLDSNKTAKEIAYELGYSSPQHFSKAFKKAFKHPPNYMRKNPDCTI